MQLCCGQVYAALPGGFPIGAGVRLPKAVQLPGRMSPLSEIGFLKTQFLNPLSTYVCKEMRHGFNFLSV